MKLISWNVNGLRAVLGKGFLDYVAQENRTFRLQETKLHRAGGLTCRDTPVFQLADKKGFRHGHSHTDVAFP